MNLNDIFANADEPKNFTPTRKNVLIPVLAQQMRNENKREYKRAEEPTFRASGIGGCQRKMMYQLLGYETELEHLSVFTLQQGTIIHEMIQGYLQRAGIIESLEEELQILPNLKGHYDGVIKINGERYLLEIKTINHLAYERVSKYNTIYNKYILQAHCYMKALGLAKCLFLFVNKGHMVSEEFAKENPHIDPVFHEIELKYDEKIWQEIEDKLSLLTEQFKLGVMPPAKKVSECSYCQFAEKCQQDWKEEKSAKKKPKAAQGEQKNKK